LSSSEKRRPLIYINVSGEGYLSEGLRGCGSGQKSYQRRQLKLQTLANSLILPDKIVLAEVFLSVERLGWDD